jgi:hypothetical protein
MNTSYIAFTPLSSTIVALLELPPVSNKNKLFTYNLTLDSAPADMLNVYCPVMCAMYTPAHLMLNCDGDAFVCHTFVFKLEPNGFAIEVMISFPLAVVGEGTRDLRKA